MNPASGAIHKNILQVIESCRIFCVIRRFVEADEGLTVKYNIIDGQMVDSFRKDSMISISTDYYCRRRKID